MENDKTIDKVDISFLKESAMNLHERQEIHNLNVSSIFDFIYIFKITSFKFFLGSGENFDCLGHLLKVIGSYIRLF